MPLAVADVTERSDEMWLFAVLGILLVVISYFAMNRNQHKSVGVLASAEAVPLNEIKEKVAGLVATGVLQVTESAIENSAIFDRLGPVTRDFFSRYPSIKTANGGLQLSTANAHPSDYIDGLVSIGNSEDWDVVVRPLEDEIFVAEGSEKSLRELEVNFPTIYHLVVHECSLISPRSSDENHRP